MLHINNLLTPEEKTYIENFKLQFDIHDVHFIYHHSPKGHYREKIGIHFYGTYLPGKYELFITLRYIDGNYHIHAENMIYEPIELNNKLMCLTALSYFHTCLRIREYRNTTPMTFHRLHSLNYRIETHSSNALCFGKQAVRAQIVKSIAENIQVINPELGD